jgi:hypothetical protein
MKRDLDLIRRILLCVEKSDHAKLPEVDERILNEHIHLLVDAGFVEGVETEDNPSWSMAVERLTWKGQEFLDAIRDPAIDTSQKGELRE